MWRAARVDRRRRDAPSSTLPTTRRLVARRVPFLLVLLLLTVASPSARAAPRAALDPATLDGMIRAQMRLSRIPGVAVSIATADGVVYQSAFGEADGTAITPESPFILGSTSKSFTALAVLQLVEAGRVELDAPATRYLPRLALRQGEGWDAITVRHLLNQTGGIPQASGFRRLGDAASAERVRLDDLATVSAPGERHEYSNLNYSLLGLIVEAASGTGYEAYVRENIFDPLEMGDSYIDRERAAANGLVPGHQYWYGLAIRRDEPAVERHAIPAGFIISSAADMGNYLSMILDDGRYRDRTILGPEYVTSLLEPWDGEVGSYAMGWDSGEWNGIPVVEHSGLTAAYSSIMLLMPEQGFGVTVLTNVNSALIGSAPDALMDGIVRHLADQPPITHYPIELVIRLGFLGLILFGVYGLWRDFRRWRAVGSPTRVERSPAVIGRLVVELAIAVGLLVFIPRLFGTPLSAMLALQPDLALTLVVGALLTALSAPLSALLRSHERGTAAPDGAPPAPVPTR